MSFKLAPGVRIRVSSRGVRGVGPFTFSDSLGSGNRSRATYSRRGGAPTRASLADLARQSAAAEREEIIRSVLALEHALVTVHLQDFPATTRPHLPEPAPPDTASLIAAREQQALDPQAALRRRGTAGHVVGLPLDDESGLAGIIDEVRASLVR